MEKTFIQGIPKEDLLKEEESFNTLQNMQYSKKIIETIEGKRKYKVIFSTSNYHVFRAGMYAKKARLKANGIGAKTPFYFWYNAILREFVAILVMYRNWHIVILIFVATLMLGIMYVLHDLEMLKTILRYLGYLK